MMIKFWILKRYTLTIKDKESKIAEHLNKEEFGNYSTPNFPLNT